MKRTDNLPLQCLESSHIPTILQVMMSVSLPVTRDCFVGNEVRAKRGEIVMRSILPKPREDMKKHLPQWRECFSCHKTERTLRFKVLLIWIVQCHCQPWFWTWHSRKPLLLAHSLLRLANNIDGSNWIFASLKNSYVEILTPNVMVFGDGAFGR